MIGALYFFLYCRAMIRSLIIITIILSFSYANAQEYWQQKVDYKINVTLDDSLHSVAGDIEIIYKNNSPNELSFIYFHLWPNAYKTETTALCEQMLLQGDINLYNATDEERGEISELDFISESTSLKWEYDSVHIDIAKINLQKPLKSGESIKISTKFKVKIPSSDFSRLGHAEQSYQITQWYPKPAVYDSKGWHQMPYLNQGEFYSEFGTYDVSITVPKNYIIGATGDLVNGESEELWLDSISDATKRIDEYETDLSFPLSSKQTKTLVYHQDNVHDFAWFADKRYHVLREVISLKNGQEVLMQAMFTNQEADLWKESLKYLEQSTKFYSEFVGDYPYKHVTAVQGALSAGAGMEYPNITIIGLSDNKYGLEETIMHEVGHNWFYGMLGFNERKHPWMDEGLNSFVQNEYMKNYHPELTLSELYFSKKIKVINLDKIGEQYLNYISNKFMASYNLDQACGLPSDEFTSYNYGISVYQKTSLIIDYLQQYLGKDNFGSIFKDFFTKWQYKHPQPEDFINHFEKQSGKDLSWLLDDLINTTNLVDYKITSIDKSGDSIKVSIKNIGDVKAPVCIKTKSSDGNNVEEVWIDGFNNKKTISIAKSDFEEISINSDYSLLDYTPGNNTYKSNKILPKSRKLKLELITTIPMNNEQYIYYTPVIGWNNYDKFMAGVLIFNHSLLEKKWEYQLMPLYSFNQKALTGSFALHRNFYTQGFIRRISIGINGKQYEYDKYLDGESNLAYLKLSPEIKFYFKNPNGNTNIKHQARIRLVNVNKEVKSYPEHVVFSSTISIPIRKYTEYNIFTLDYSFHNNRRINPFGTSINVQAGTNIIKASMTAEYAFSYNKVKTNAFEIRFFIGNVFKHETNQWVDYSFKMSSFDGGDDYLYDYTYMDRSGYSNFYSSQVTPSDGGFYLPSSIGRSWGFISALNLRGGLPYAKFIKLYGNFGYSLSSENRIFYDKKLLAEGGVLLTFFNRTFEVYFPLLWSSDYQRVFDLYTDHKYSDNIRFTIRLDLMDPFKIKKEINL